MYFVRILLFCVIFYTLDISNILYFSANHPFQISPRDLNCFCMMLWALSYEANANPQHVGEHSPCNTDCDCIKVKLHQTQNHIAFCSSRCHLLQTSSSNLLALCPCRTCPPFPCRDPQGHRGGHKPHEGIPDRTSWSNHSEGTYSILFWTDCYLKFKMSKETKKGI